MTRFRIVTLAVILFVLPLVAPAASASWETDGGGSGYPGNVGGPGGDVTDTCSPC